MKISDYYIGRGFLHPEKLKIAEKYRGKSLVDFPSASEHNGVAEIRLCPYMYWCYKNGETWLKLREYERPIREEWKKDGILKDCSHPEFTAKGKKFVEYVLKWAYPKDYIELVLNLSY